jgi:hypothetical protein
MAARDFFEVMKVAIAAIAPGLKNFGPQVSAELKRQATLGASEMAHLIFTGSAYVPYGPGQYTDAPDLDKAGQEHDLQKAEPDLEREQGGREM